MPRRSGTHGPKIPKAPATQSPIAMVSSAGCREQDFQELVEAYTLVRRSLRRGREAEAGRLQVAADSASCGICASFAMPVGARRSGEHSVDLK